MTATRLISALLLLIPSASPQRGVVSVELIRPEIQVVLGANNATLRLVAVRRLRPGETIEAARRSIWDGYKGRSFEEWFPGE